MPAELRAEIEAHMAQLPRPPLGGAAGARGRAARARLVLARGDRAGRLRDARDARLPGVGRELLRHARDRARSGATASTCARTSPARCAAPTSCTTAALRRGGASDAGGQRARVRVPRRVRHRADGLGRRRLRRAADAARRARAARGPARRPPGAAREAARAPARRRPAREQRASSRAPTSCR